MTRTAKQFIDLALCMIITVSPIIYYFWNLKD